MGAERIRALGAAALPIVAILSFVAGVGLTIAAAGDTLGYDFLAYHAAMERLLAGAPLYDMSYTATGGFGLFYYPPTFAPLILALGALDEAAATWSWIALSLAAFLGGVAILPTVRAVRWWTILLAGWSFPFVYAVKLGQVGPILFALFAMGWRGMDRPALLGTSGALGAAIKLQPGLVLLWAALTGRWRAVIAGAAVIVVLAVMATLVAGPGAWPDFLTLLRTVSDPIATEKNMTPGAVAYRAGLPAGLAAALQLVTTVASLGLALAAIRWCRTEVSYLVVVVVSQLVSPILWDHYAMLLLLPVAFLLAAGRRWALAIPLVTAWPLLGVGPDALYPLAFAVTLAALMWVGRRMDSASA